jgi:NAD dependent epimerase/dehydratase family enzyme
MSAVALADVARAITFALATDTVRGPVNVVGPTPVTNAEFTDRLAHALRRPAFLAVPRTALRIALGTREADELALASQRVIPSALLAAGFHYAHPTLDDMLRAALTS